ncbi:MAG: PQQ-binding-like beta-propeller repeat protein, partial [Planctomycetes bacterium]|nr:PQQ-binding-like beta-propeller repeat protein [Planctomycetota bacterium]
MSSRQVLAQAPENVLAQQILEATGVQGGLIIHLGCGDGKLTAALKAGDGYMVHGLDRVKANVDNSRKYIQSRGLYGVVSVDRLQGDKLPYIDNLANLVVSEDLDGIAMEEILRVLAPNGTAYIKTGDTWTKTIKPRPDNIDEWTHYMHDASGNAVAHDTVVGPPRHLQWVGSPRWSRHHDRMASISALVSAGGRMFYVADEGSRISIEMPPKWTLIARDAFNGTILWKRSIKDWQNHLWPLKSGPTQLARRLVAVGDRVYVTLGYHEPLTALDAATGKTVHTFQGSKSTEEIILSEGTLFLLVNKGKYELDDFGPKLNTGDQGRVRKEYRWNEKPRQILAVDAKTGRIVWKKDTLVSPITLAADNKRVLYHNGRHVVCLDRANGNELWKSIATQRKDVTMNFGPKLVVHQNVVLFAGGDRSMTSFAVESGKKLWSATHPPSGYQSPEDLLILGGLVWSAPLTRTSDSGVFKGRDLLTGEVKKEFPPDVETYWFHHRCYIAKATDRFLMPSRTGIEFVDPLKEHWDINHWVRGGCLYGVMPCNGLTYAPPHNCACYPEAKLYGFNALAPSSPSRLVPRKVPDEGRLEKGPAYNAVAAKSQSTFGNPKSDDWPTFRHDSARSGSTKSSVPVDLKKLWENELTGKLTAPTVGDGKLFVAQIETHTVYALDEKTGKTVWSYTTGGRVDSPPTIFEKKVLFGSADGWVYCLRSSDGALVWRFRAAPLDRRLSSYEQLESVWPVHGSILVQDGYAYFVSGRSNFLDGGLRWYKLNPQTGQKLEEVLIDEIDPETGKNLQSRIQTLQMPVGLPDILSSDGGYVYMRSQKFDFNGNRLEIGPHSGNAAEQGAEQSGEGRHLFAPMGYLDGTWFHRSYWVYGRSFAGGHNGYYQAGKYTPSGRILVSDDETVYGFGRKPQYLKWTTTMEHQLFASSKNAPIVDPRIIRRGGRTSMIQVANSKSLDPTGKPLAVEAWVNASRPDGVVVSRGGPSNGYALIIRGGRPRFVIRSDQQISSVNSNQKVVNKWVHLAGVLTADKKLQIYIDGKLANETKASSLIASVPLQAMEIGSDDKGSVGSYASPLAFSGTIDEVRIFHGSLSAAEIQDHFENTGSIKAKNAELVLSFSFNDGKATDSSGNKNNGQSSGVQKVQGKVGSALKFTGRPGRGGNSFVQRHWARDIPLLVRAMVLADKTLFVAGPEDLVDEDDAFSRLVNGDKKIQEKLAEQQAVFDGKRGALLHAVSTSDGKTVAKYRLQSLPVWDGMAAAHGRLFLSTT